MIRLCEKCANLPHERNNSLPLSEKVRIEVYVPGRSKAHYHYLCEAFGDECTEAFGGCTVQRGFEGRCFSDSGVKTIDGMNVVYTDLPLALPEYLAEIAAYTDEIRKAAHEILEEESILVTVRTIFHAE